MNNYFIIFRTQGKAFLSLTEDKSLCTFRSAEKAKAAFETGYKSSHELDATWSTSAALHWLGLNPFIITLPTTMSALEVLKTLTEEDEPNLQVQRLSSVAVRTLNVVEVNLEACLKLEIDQKVEMYNPDWYKQNNKTKLP